MGLVAEKGVTRRFGMKGEGMSMRYCKNITGAYGQKAVVVICHPRA